MSGVAGKNPNKYRECGWDARPVRPQIPKDYPALLDERPPLGVAQFIVALLQNIQRLTTTKKWRSLSNPSPRASGLDF